MSDDRRSIEAQAYIHHQYFLGLQLMVVMREGPEAVGDWMFRIFRRQHEDKFLASFEKLGLSDLPDAVACAQYHTLSNSMGGVPVEYMAETEKKAWVRFRYPRWMYDGPTLCGVPVEASRGFLKGWYAQNGVSLKNPRLGFVCVSEDMTGQFGLCGYFKEYDHELSEEDRLQFAPNELPPPFDADNQPAPPIEQWNALRLLKANRNYAVDYIRNGIRELVGVIGRDRALELGKSAARLTGLQNRRRLSETIGTEDRGSLEAARLLAAMFQGMGDKAVVKGTRDNARVTINHGGLRIARGLTAEGRQDLIDCWIEIWRGVVQSHRTFMDVDVSQIDDGLEWSLSER
ncbi:MAG: hypothetical protein OXD42_04470 [Rhodospirillaceae bacterium]|nr:hypothetical protein [Rhodospirillaceae bacterium]MCY4239757.1 hypothetical protein [Rhodospirillaceae bacterium]